MRTRWVVPAVLAAAVAASVLLTGTSAAFIAEGRPWPGGVVRYYNAAPDDSFGRPSARAALRIQVTETG